MIRLIAFGCILMATTQVVTGQTAPNLIFVLTDDHGIDAMQGPGWTNELSVHTPRLATLAEQGRAFPWARTNPVCSSTRAGILTGRTAFSTGVTDVVSNSRFNPDVPKMGLQNHEWTLAEALKTRGYHTILIDKWHVGSDDERSGQRAIDQGFDRVVPGARYFHLDDPIAIGDEHLSRMVDFAVTAVRERPDPSAPYALFFWTADPHDRDDPSGRETLDWWRVDSRLLPSGEDYYGPGRDSNLNRYRAVVEAIDTEVHRMLRELDIINRDDEYRPQSNTVLIFMGDNGTPRKVAAVPDRAKPSLYEGGTRVPLFFFGQSVPADGRLVDRLIGHTDLYETIADIADIADGDRGTFKRDSQSFADAIGWSSAPLPEREFTVSSRGGDEATDHLVAIADRQYKLIVSGGSATPEPYDDGLFFDLQADPEERHNLLSKGDLSVDEQARFVRMRETLTDRWPSAVPGPSMGDVYLSPSHIMGLATDNSISYGLFPVGHENPGSGSWKEWRGFIRWDLEVLVNNLPPGVEIDDIETAQIVLVFAGDTRAPFNSDTALLTAFACEEDWYSVQTPKWRNLKNAHDNARPLGDVDFPMFIVPDPIGDLVGHPLPLGAMVSLGRSDTLLSLIADWADRPWANDGVVLKAAPLETLGGDQRIGFLPEAYLRLVFRK